MDGAFFSNPTNYVKIWGRRRERLNFQEIKLCGIGMENNNKKMNFQTYDN